MQDSEKSDQAIRRDTDSFSRALVSCALMLVCAGLLLVAMRWFSNATPQVLPAAHSAGVPDRRLRFVTCDVQFHHLQNEPVLAEIEKLAPDYLILQNSRESDVRAVADATHLQWVFLAGPERRTSADGPPGNAVLAKSAVSLLGSAGSLRMCVNSPIGPGKIFIASIALPFSGTGDGMGNLASLWKDQGCPPIVVAGAFPHVLQEDDLVEAKTGWFDALAPWLRLVPDSPIAHLRPRIFLSPGWSCVAGGSFAAHGLTAAWIDAGSSAFVTAPTTRAATQPDDE